MKPQTQLQSGLEVAFNYVIGFTVAWLMNKFLFHKMGYAVSDRDNTQLTLVLTGISILRSYLTRRFFNWIHKRQHEKEAKEASGAQAGSRRGA